MRNKSTTVYDSIDELPIYNWIKCHEAGSTIYVYRLESYANRYETTESKTAFEKIYRQFFVKYGLTSEFKEYLEAKKKVLLKKLDAYLTDNKSLLTFVKIEEAEIKQKYESNIKEVDYWNMVASLEEALGFQIDVHKMSVESFYNHLKNQTEKNKRLAKWQKR